ncbi:transcription initiation factor TFIID subunit 9-like [Monodelphis domestica]|uniref:transcription initiation factor TFIID subunit 9-like n=1 Tax=Monodelphis domestica TaxID=13616 RepID=UPI0024E23565|nr:transcription initiation factor TFIID subunit 9-like [Monodelphis domestica]
MAIMAITAIANNSCHQLEELPVFFLPPKRYCLTAPNYRLKPLSEKGPAPAGRITVPHLHVGAVISRPNTPTLGNPPAQPAAAPNKARTPASGPPQNQRFAVQMPPSQSAVPIPGNEMSAKPAAPAAPAVQNVMINHSLMGQKNILITTNVVSQNTPVESPNALKRKHEDDDDYDNL